MKIELARGTTENGIVIGNTYDKYHSKNPIVKHIMGGFHSSLIDLVRKADPRTIHEIGCGEGYWVLKWAQQGIAARGCDFSSQVIDMARKNAEANCLSAQMFDVRSIYEVEPERDSADLIVCCEVLEHLEHPEKGLQALRRITKKSLIVSVPDEPLWRILNLARGKYVSHMGNTPGHIQHWSRTGFIKLASTYFDVVETRLPLPWIMLLCHPRM